MRGTRYSRFINGIQRAGILLNRKMLSQIAIDDPKTFDELVQISEKHTKAHGEPVAAPPKEKKTTKKKSAPKKSSDPKVEEEVTA